MATGNRTSAERLRALIEEAKEGRPSNFDLWRERTRAELIQHYGDPNHPEVNRFINSLVPNVIHSDHTVASGEFAQAEAEALNQGIAQLEVLAEQLEAEEPLNATSEVEAPAAGGWKATAPAPDPTFVWVVHGRNLKARDGMFAFLRALDLRPLEWDQAVGLTGKGAPYVGEVLDRAFESAAVVVVLMTPDEIAYLRSEYAAHEQDPDTQPAPQARPNVLFEAGMALGRHPDRTIIVEMGSVRPFSDIAGRHLVRLDGSPASRKALAQRRVNLPGFHTGSIV
jgi:predicted nucleotide-binding protein